MRKGGRDEHTLTAAVWFRLVHRALTREASPVVESAERKEPEVRPLETSGRGKVIRP